MQSSRHFCENIWLEGGGLDGDIRFSFAWVCEGPRGPVSVPCLRELRSKSSRCCGMVLGCRHGPHSLPLWRCWIWRVSLLQSRCLPRKPTATRPVLWSTIKVMFWWTVVELQICLWHIYMPNDSWKGRHICDLTHTDPVSLQHQGLTVSWLTQQRPAGLLSWASTVPRHWGHISGQRSLLCGTAVLVL